MKDIIYKRIKSKAKKILPKLNIAVPHYYEVYLSFEIFQEYDIPDVLEKEGSPFICLSAEYGEELFFIDADKIPEDDDALSYVQGLLTEHFKKMDIEIVFGEDCYAFAYEENNEFIG